MDDSRRDFYLNAYQILREYALPAMMYLPTAYLDGAWLWFHRYQYLFRADEARAGGVPRFGGLWPAPARFVLAIARAAAFSVLVRRGQWLWAEHRGGLVHALSRLLRVPLPEKPRDKFTPLAWDEVREMAHHGIEFGNHTVNYPIPDHPGRGMPRSGDRRMQAAHRAGTAENSGPLCLPEQE